MLQASFIALCGIRRPCMQASEDPHIEAHRVPQFHVLHFLTCLQARKDPTQHSLEARLRNARYIAELTKFRLAPAGTFFSLLKGLLDDFSGHNVDAAAALVETAGRYLFCIPETQTRISNMLDVSGLFHPCPDCFHVSRMGRDLWALPVLHPRDTDAHQQHAGRERAPRTPPYLHTWIAT